VEAVGKQSFLYCLAYFLSFIWPTAIGVLDGRDFEKKNVNAGDVYFPLMVCVSLLLPAQGLFNSLVYFRPKYLSARKQYPKESKIWAMKRAVLGRRVSPINQAAAIDIGNIRCFGSGENVSKLSSGASKHTSSLARSESQLDKIVEKKVEKEHPDVEGEPSRAERDKLKGRFAPFRRVTPSGGIVESFSDGDEGLNDDKALVQDPDEI